MKRKERGVTLIALVVTIVVLLILASIGIGAITSDNGVIKQSNETKQSAERESIIEKIEADLYTEKTKTGKTPSKNDLKELIKEKDFGTVNEDDSFTNRIWRNRRLGIVKDFMPILDENNTYVYITN